MSPGLLHLLRILVVSLAQDQSSRCHLPGADWPISQHLTDWVAGPSLVPMGQAAVPPASGSSQTVSRNCESPGEVWGGLQGPRLGPGVCRGGAAPTQCSCQLPPPGGHWWEPLGGLVPYKSTAGSCPPPTLVLPPLCLPLMGIILQVSWSNLTPWSPSRKDLLCWLGSPSLGLSGFDPGVSSAEG